MLNVFIVALSLLFIKNLKNYSCIRYMVNVDGNHLVLRVVKNLSKTFSSLHETRWKYCVKNALKNPTALEILAKVFLLFPLEIFVVQKCIFVLVLLKMLKRFLHFCIGAVESVAYKRNIVATFWKCEWSHCPKALVTQVKLNTINHRDKEAPRTKVKSRAVTPPGPTKTPVTKDPKGLSKKRRVGKTTKEKDGNGRKWRQTKDANVGWDEAASELRATTVS